MKKQEIKKVLELGEGLEKQAELIFSYESAINALFEKLVNETSKNYREQQRVWSEVHRALAEKYPEESEIEISFNHRLGKFIVYEEIKDNYRDRP